MIKMELHCQFFLFLIIDININDFVVMLEGTFLLMDQSSTTKEMNKMNISYYSL